MLECVLKRQACRGLRVDASKSLGFSDAYSRLASQLESAVEEMRAEWIGADPHGPKLPTRLGKPGSERPRCP